MKKLFLYILTIIFLAGLFGPIEKINAQSMGTCTYRSPLTSALGSPDTAIETEAQCKGRTPPGSWKKNAVTGYHLLAPIGDITDFNPTIDATNPNPLSNYLNTMIKIIIGLAAVLSVVMIVVGGIEYMTSELAHTKEAGKEKITQAILGLILALGAYTLLFTINPDLLKSDIDPSNVVIQTPAPEVLGTCIVIKSGGNITYPDISNANCISLLSQQITNVRWTPNSTTAGEGTCIVKENGDDITYTNMSNANCNSFSQQPTNVRWSSN